ncbi:hypothetical protein IFM89_026162, partial [Coptis chinensis]
VCEGGGVKKKGICGNGEGGVCAICLDTISLEEMALVKGGELAYWFVSLCDLYILRWATYHEKPCCPQCKHPFQFLNIHRSLDGRIHDYMFEESVCPLLRATWSSSVRIGNCRWGDNGYVRGGRIEARPINRFQDPDAGPSRGPKKEAVKDATGRRAKRALKREAADKAAAAKHQSHLQRLGRN